MAKKKEVTIKIEMDLRTAAAVRQILFEAQKGYTYNPDSAPPRINDVRNVIYDLDDKIACAIDPE